MWLYGIWGGITSIYLIKSARRDLAERMIYSAPMAFLYIAWSIYIWKFTGWDDVFLTCFWFVHLVLYLVFNHLAIWGGGDSDLFLLFADICLVSIPVCDIQFFVMLECLLLVMGLLLSVGIGAVESYVKGKRFTSHGYIAVVPGVAFVMIVLLIWGFCWRL